MSRAVPSRGKRAVIPAAVAVGALVLAAIIATGGGSGSDQVEQDVATESSQETTAPTEDASADANQAGTSRSDEAMAMGAADAPVVMVNYSEFQCPFCGRFARDTAPELIERYVEPGLLRIEWRDFPYLGEESTRAALAARAAAAQDAFWEFHDALFADQADTPNSGKLTEDYLIGLARDLDLDMPRFEDDFHDGAGEAAIRVDFDEGLSIGVNGTPTFLVNGTPVVGAQPLDVFVQTIETAISDAS